MSFKTKALKCLEEGNYEEYFKYTKMQHELDKTEESAAELEKARKKLELLKEIKEFMKKEKACYYDVLGIDKNSNQKQIREAYTKLMNKFHPDRTKIKESNAVSRIIQKAYSILSKPEKRTEYDLKLNNMFYSSGPNYRFTVSSHINDSIFDYARFNGGHDFTSFTDDYENIFMTNNRFFDAHLGSHIYNNLFHNLNRRNAYRRVYSRQVEEKFVLKLMLFVVFLIVIFSLS